MLARLLSRACAAALLFSFAQPAFATDVDGPNDCARNTHDMGDAPEGIDAYPGVPGAFPTCLAAGPVGTHDIACPPISTPPGPAGHAIHTNFQPVGYWLGCASGSLPMGIDSEPDGKVNFGGGPLSACSQIPVDCVEGAAFGAFGQDECFGDDDAGLLALPALTSCSTSALDLSIYNCNDQTQIFLNVLIDMNMDGDWNDNFQCPAGGCAYEWVLKNITLTIPTGCTTITTPSFLVGPLAGSHGWMRVAISEEPMTDDYPWAGTAGPAFPDGAAKLGEVEDYLLEFDSPPPGDCEVGYTDFGDAPEEIPAYASGIAGNFPTCIFPSGPGTQEIECAAGIAGTPPGPTGYVEHVKMPQNPNGFWWGCDMSGTGAFFVDSEPNGKVNFVPVAGDPSACDQTTPVDCVETSGGGVTFGQDECYLDGVDAGLMSPPVFSRCDSTSIRARLFNCSTTEITVIVNVLVDWNEDGDWNDVLACPQVPSGCAPEWVVYNLPVVLAPGCNVWTSPLFQVGPRPGEGWMRLTVTQAPVTDDFPWAGSVTGTNEVFFGGETEDYPVLIEDSPVGVELNESLSGLAFAPITPNPVTNQAELRFSLERHSSVKLHVYDVTGRRVRTLIDGVRGAGSHATSWDLRTDQGTKAAAGIYLVRLETHNEVQTRRMIHVR